jgi:hypothetical protein
MNEDPTVSVPESGSMGTKSIPEAIVLTAAARQYLTQTGPWIRFFSILLFVLSGLMFLAGVGMILLGIVSIYATGGFIGAGFRRSGAVAVILGPIYVLMSLLFYVAPAIFLFRYASAIKTLQLNGTALVLEDALRHQKAFWRYLGIVTVIMLIVAVLVGVAVGFLTAFLSMRN